MRRRYRVVIPYHEPTYEARQSAPTEPFRAEFQVSAATPEEAVQTALARFEGQASDSSVGWIREPVEEAIRVDELG